MKKPTQILVVEDNEDLRRILVLRLRHGEGVVVREATTGHEALQCIAQAPPDLVLLDLQLPLLDGWETARRIRALPAPLNALPLIAVTASVGLEDLAKALAAGCNELITKPVDFRALHATLHRVLARRGMPA
jgi:two-component system, cell cycle response regulator DivK